MEVTAEYTRLCTLIKAIWASVPGDNDLFLNIYVFILGLIQEKDWKAGPQLKLKRSGLCDSLLLLLFVAAYFSLNIPNLHISANLFLFEENREPVVLIFFAKI